MNKIYVKREELFCHNLSVWVCNEIFNNGIKSIMVAENMVVKTFIEGTSPPPLLTIQPQEAQFLIDQLWDCGLRPSEGSGSAGAMAATEKHLEDMRTLVFKK